MDQQHYEELVDRKRGLPCPERITGHHSMKSNLRQEAKLYTLDGDLLRRGGLPVIREADLKEEEVEKVHGRFGGLNHNCGLPVTWLNTIWLNFFVETFGLKIFKPSDHKIKPTPFQLKE